MCCNTSYHWFAESIITFRWCVGVSARLLGARGSWSRTCWISKTSFSPAATLCSGSTISHVSWVKTLRCRMPERFRRPRKLLLRATTTSLSSLQLFYFSFLLLPPPPPPSVGPPLSAPSSGKLRGDVTAAERVTKHRCLSYFSSFVSLFLPPSYPSSLPQHPCTPSSAPLHLPYVFVVCYPPPHHHHNQPIPSSSPLSILQPSLEKMRSGAFCPQINRPYSPLSRAAEAASSLYSAVQFVQWGRGRERRGGGGTQGC